jgi:hypothetical protein
LLPGVRSCSGFLLIAIEGGGITLTIFATLLKTCSMFRFSIAFVLGLSILTYCCQSPDKGSSHTLPTRALALSDLKFPDYDKQWIQQQHIDTIFSLSKDTFIKLAFGNVISSWDSVRMIDGKLHRVGYVAYDSLGRPIFESIERYISFRYWYDTAGVLTHRLYQEYDIAYDDTSTYLFDKAGLVLIQTWKPLRIQREMISQYEFDSAGYLQRDTVVEKFQREERVITTAQKYYYDDGLPIKILREVRGGNKLYSKKETTIYYDQNHKIQSTVALVDDEYHNYRMVTNYFKGLKANSVVNDTLTIFYEYSYRQ